MKSLAFAEMENSWEAEQAQDHCRHREGTVHLGLVNRSSACPVIDSPYARHSCLYVAGFHRNHVKVTRAGCHSRRFLSDDLHRPVLKHRYPKMTVAYPDSSFAVLFEIRQKLPVTTDQVVVVLAQEKGIARPCAFPYDEVRT